LIQAVIFDMDGVIIDSEPFQSLAFKEVLAEYGLGPFEEAIVQTPGVTTERNWEVLRERYGIPDAVESLSARSRAAYVRIISDRIQARPGALELISSLKEAGYKLALASSSIASVKVVVESLRLGSQFDVILRGSDVSRHKPNPEIFLLAAQRLAVEPCACLVIEDSAAGVQAAKRAGMKCIATPTASTLNQDISAADLVLSCLTHIDLKLIQSL